MSISYLKNAFKMLSFRELLPKSNIKVFINRLQVFALNKLIKSLNPK